MQVKRHSINIFFEKKKNAAENLKRRNSKGKELLKISWRCNREDTVLLLFFRKEPKKEKRM